MPLKRHIMSMPDVVRRLVARFAEHEESYRGSQYNELQLRREFLDPFLKALGWDVDNTQSYPEAYKDVIHGDSIKVGSSTKMPDYCLRIGGIRKMFLEAKKPAINVKTDGDGAFQLRRYAWSAKLPVGVISNFREFSVYDCRNRPQPTDIASLGRVRYFTFDQLETIWDEIAGIFSKEAVLKGAFDKFAQVGKGKRGTVEVDSAFLAEIEEWRKALCGHVVGFAPRST